MLKKILYGFLFFSLMIEAKELLFEKSLIKGKLDNGFEYTIKKNKKPINKISLRLLVKVGSLEEDEDQKGVAHLVEHMAFNGSKNFKGNDLIKFLESVGVEFGTHLNASTGTEKTTYTLEIPLKNDNLEKAILVFSDWAGGIDFTLKELDKERGIIIEEERSSRGLRSRIYNKAKNVLYAGSKYKDRSPIGDMDIIKNISLKRVKDFYNHWYRPEFMHFAIVGNIDVKKTEELIKKYFKNFKNNSNRKRVNRNVPKVDKTRVLIIKDKELTTSRVELNFFEDNKVLKSEEDYRKALIGGIMVKLFNEKASEQILKRNPAANNIYMLSKGLSPNLRSYTFAANYNGVKELSALKDLTNVMYYLEKYGFNKEDFKRIIKDYKKSNKEVLESLENKTSSSYANQIIGRALYNDIFIDEKYKVSLVDRLLNSIKLQEIEDMYRKIFHINSRLISYTISENIELSKRRVKHILKDAKNHVNKEKKTNNLPKDIKISKLKPAKIINEVYNKDYDFYEFTLENGIKIAYKYNDYKKNYVSLSAYSKGGFSLYETKDLANAKYAAQIITSSGFDKYNILEVQKIHSNKSSILIPSIARYAEGLAGSSTTRDFDFLLKSVYLLAYKYKFDDNIFENFKQITISSLKKENRVPSLKFARQLNEFYYQKNKRFSTLNIDDIKTLDKKTMLKIYKDKFSDFNNFMFFIVGDIKKEEVKKYASLYLGNLPTLKRTQNYKYRGIKPREGKHKFIRNLNNENISKVSFSYRKETPYSLEESIKLSVFVDVLKRKLREFIREEKSGIYNISVQGIFSRDPYEEAYVEISFSCNPSRREELLKYVKEVIEDMKTNLVEEKYINSYIKKRLIALKENKKKASFWSIQLINHYYHNDDLSKIEEYEKLYKEVNLHMIKEAANKYLNTKNIIYTELNPKIN